MRPFCSQHLTDLRLRALRVHRPGM
jgi:hypothetical protein